MLIKFKILKKIICVLTIYIFTISVTYGVEYIYKNNKTNASSISVVSDPTFTFASKSQVLLEPFSGKIIYANNENEKISPASVTKVMTLILIMEQIDSGKLKYSDFVTCSTNASKMGGSQIWFKENEKLTIDEALKAICVVSANDVTLAMAELIGGDENNFVRLMNEKAKLLNMNNTNFVNCHGIDDDNHYTTALDIAIMSKELYVKHPDILKYTSIWMDTLRNGTFALSSTNKLIRFYEGANGLKTGSTSKALFSLTASAKKNDTSMIAVVCTAPSSDVRLNEVKQLLDYGFNNYESSKIFDKYQVIQDVNINKNIGKKYNVCVSDMTNILVEKGSKQEYDIEVKLNELNAPLIKNNDIGKIIVKDKKGNCLTEKNLCLIEDVNKSNLKDYFNYNLKRVCGLK
ncbi:MAG: D-alanyl-D-alanine carboxypeptidase family protein [Clostridia bacterium]